MPTPDEINRDKFYSDRSADDEDDADYELEPLDTDVLEAEKQRAEEAIAASQTAIDIDRIYRDLEERQDGGVVGEWLRGFRGGFHFQVKHLLILTAVVSIGLTLWKLGLLGEVLSLAVVGGIIGVYMYSQWRENQARAEADSRRDEMYARRRAHFDKSRGVDASLDAAASTTNTRAKLGNGPLPPNGDDDAFQEAMTKPKFRFQFSLKQLMMAMTVSAFILGLVHIFGGPAPTATMLGVVALGGLVVHAVGYEPPEIVALGWWLLLALYVLLSIVGVIWSGA